MVYTSGSKCKIVTESKYAPLNANKSLIINFLGLDKMTKRKPTKTERIKRI